MKTDKYKEKLEKEKAVLENELGSFGKLVNEKIGDWKAVPESEMNSQEVQDEGDIAERSEDFEERASKVDVLEVRLEEINEALENIKNNKFGICKKCGIKIEEDRLGANPAAQTCKSCLKK